MKKTGARKKNRRSQQKYPALDPQYNLKTRADLIDQDYVDKLSESDKDWLNRFNEEYVNANFKHSGKKLHKSDTLKRDCYNRNNHRNRDILTRAKASGSAIYLEDLKGTEKDLFQESQDESHNLDNTSNNSDNSSDDTNSSEN